MATFDQSRIDGGPFRWASEYSPKDENGNPVIVFTGHHPTDAEKSLAGDMGGVKFNDEGEVDTSHVEIEGASERTKQMLASNASKPFLARLCIDSVEGLDGWPEAPHKNLGGGYKMLTDEAAGLIPDIILDEFASDLFRASVGSKMEGKL